VSWRSDPSSSLFDDGRMDWLGDCGHSIDGSAIRAEYATGLIVRVSISWRANREESSPSHHHQPFDSEKNDRLRQRHRLRLPRAFGPNLNRAQSRRGAHPHRHRLVNCWLVRDLRVPFGGMKQSGVAAKAATKPPLLHEPKTLHRK